MNGLNKVILVGTLGQDPKANTTQTGKSYTSLSLATNRHWKNDDGKEIEATDWHRVHVWGKQGILCQRFLKKGNPVCVEGRITTTHHEDNGQKKYFTFITADEVNFLPARREETPQ
jgi:single-strand DNA-binding protein